MASRYILKVYNTGNTRSKLAGMKIDNETPGDSSKRRRKGTPICDVSIPEPAKQRKSREADARSARNEGYRCGREEKTQEDGMRKKRKERKRTQGNARRHEK